MPPALPGAVSAAAFSHRRSASCAAARLGRPSSTQPSSSTAAAYPPSTWGSAPGVATTRAGRGGTELIVAEPADTTTGAPGNALASSSAVRRDPATTALSRPWPQAGHRHSASLRPHQRQPAGASLAATASGPPQVTQRAAARQRSQATAVR